MPDYSKDPLTFWNDYAPFVGWRKSKGYTNPDISLDEREIIIAQFRLEGFEDRDNIK